MPVLQASVGDNTTDRPGFFDPKGKAKWDACESLQATVVGLEQTHWAECEAAAATPRAKPSGTPGSARAAAFGGKLLRAVERIHGEACSCFSGP